MCIRDRIEPSTGEILCLVTSPTYDPSMLLGRNFSKSYKELEDNPLKPLFNRAIQGMYPPGSTFKPTQGLIFLQEDIITSNTLYACAGGYPPFCLLYTSIRYMYIIRLTNRLIHLLKRLNHVHLAN